MWDAGAVVYWFKLVRGKDGVDWVPYQADGDAGIGRQIIVADINRDGLPDLASGGMKGAHVLRHMRETVSAERWKKLQPKPIEIADKPPLNGKASAIDKETGRVAGALEGEKLTVLKASAGKTSNQNMAGFKAGQWSGSEQLFWIGGKPGERLDLEISVDKEGQYDILPAFTMARDYGIVQLMLDDQPLGEPLDLYSYPDVIHSGEIAAGTRKLTAGKHTLSLVLTGANPSAAPAFIVGLDYVRLEARK
jgi:hypothetical protein